MDYLNEMEQDTQKDRYLTFSLGNETYGIEIRYVTEIIGLQTIFDVPELPDYIKGIINLRGKIIPIMDMRLRFRKNPIEYTDRTCVIVIETESLTIGLVVDRVSEVLTILEKDIVKPPSLSYGSVNNYIKSIGKTGNDVKLLIDCERLLNENEINDLSKVI